MCHCLSEQDHVFMTAREKHIQNQGLLTISSALLFVKKKKNVDDYDKKLNSRLLPLT